MISAICIVWSLLQLAALAHGAHGANQCQEPSFILEAGAFLENEKVDGNSSLIAKKAVESSAQCARICGSLPNCTHFNFLPGSRGETNFECQLFSAGVSAASAAATPSADGSTTATKICLEKKCLKRSFAFEKFANRALSNTTYILKTFSIELEQCLNKCHDEPSCRSAFWNRDNSLCQLSKISLNSVYNPRSFFKSSKSIDMFENNCVEYIMTPAGCNFMRVTGGGLKSLTDQILHKIASAEECEQMCLLRTSIADPCRSYTYDNSTASCHLMWASARVLGRSPLENMDESLAHGDLDDCVNFSLKCREANLEVKASSMRMFVGKMMARKQKKTMCEATYNGEYDFSSKFGFDECGMEIGSKSSDSAYRGVVHVKEGSTSLVTIRDKVLQVNCRVHRPVLTEEQSLSVRMNVRENNQTKLMIDDVINPPSSAPKPSFSLKILTNNSKEVDSVQIGDFGWIVLSVRNSPDDFTVTNLIARDVNSGKILKIIDEDGCVIRPDIIKEIRKIENEIRFKISFSGFQRQTEVVYHAMVESCTIDCMPKCNAHLLLLPPHHDFKGEEKGEGAHLSLNIPLHRMVRRAAEPRQLQLINDVYEVRGQRLTLRLKPFKKKAEGKIQDLTAVKKADLEVGGALVDEDVLVVKKTATLSSSFHHCFVEDITCLFTIVLASIQLFLLFSCLVIMYCYFQQWRQFRHLESHQDRHVEYYQFGTKASSSEESSHPGGSAPGAEIEA